MMLGQPAVTGAEIPYGHQNTALKDWLVRAGCRSARGVVRWLEIGSGRCSRKAAMSAVETRRRLTRPVFGGRAER
jgi:hypothetical protein